MTRILILVGLLVTPVSAQAPVLDALDRMAIGVDVDAERLFIVAAEKLPEAVHFRKVRALTEQILKAKGLTVAQARALVLEKSEVPR